MTGADPSIAEADNFCRNPDGDIDGPWCYVEEEEEESKESWESCGIEWCDSDSNTDTNGFR